MADTLNQEPSGGFIDQSTQKLMLIWKSLFYLGNFNTENMQGTGFAWLARPLFKSVGIKLSPEEDRNLNGYFTTNPSFVTLILGIFIKEHSSGRSLMAVKTYSSAFAALGDSFFWHALRPMLYLVALFICLFINPWGIAVYPLVYTSFRLFFLFTGGPIGSVMGLGTIHLFNRFRFNRWAEFVDKASMFILGAVLVKGLKVMPEYEFSAIVIPAFLAFIIGLFLFTKISRAFMTGAMVTLFLVILGFIGVYNLWII